MTIIGFKNNDIFSSISFLLTIPLPTYIHIKINLNSNYFLEVFACNLILFREIIIGSDSKPTQRMGRVIFDEIMSTIVELSKIVEIEETSTINWYDIKIERIYFDRLNTYIISFLDVIFGVTVLSSNTK